MMKRLMIFLVSAVFLVLIVMVMEESRGRGQVSGDREQNTEVGGQTSEIDTQKSAMKMALESPEEFQTQVEESREAPVPLTVPKERPKQLSEVRGQGSGGRDPGTDRDPVSAADLYFWKDYESLRKDEIRDPDSKENRGGAVQLMKARQRRVEQK